jgi:hypothetical protein
MVWYGCGRPALDPGCRLQVRHQNSVRMAVENTYAGSQGRPASRTEGRYHYSVVDRHHGIPLFKVHEAPREAEGGMTLRTGPNLLCLNSCSLVWKMSRHSPMPWDKKCYPCRPGLE